MVCIGSLPEGVGRARGGGWLCISGTIVPGHPSNPYYSCSSQSVSVFPLRAPVRSELRIPVVYRDPPRFPACSICKPPRNESVNPVTSFAAILALRRRYTHFPPNPPACLRLECKSVQTRAPPPRSGPMQIRPRLRLSFSLRSAFSVSSTWFHGSGFLGKGIFLRVLRVRFSKRLILGNEKYHE